MPLEKTFDAAKAEAEIAARWDEVGAFAAGANARAGMPAFCIMIPPPNVTGSLHVGHAFNNTLQDILVRWHRMRGFDTLWQTGQDHAGIATQMVVERELARTQQPSRRELGREEFLSRVWAWKETSGGTIIDQLKRLGASCDWSRNRFTMDPGFHDAVLRVFVEMYRKGLIFRGKRLVNWDPHFETAISDLEVETVEVDGHMWHFRYPLADGVTYEYVERDADGVETLREIRDYIAIATTRPETMLGDGAVAVHPSDTRYQGILGKMVRLPLADRLIPIIADDYPDPAFGSGAVKITGAHDFNDYAVAKRHGIPLYPLMDTRARMTGDQVPERYRGLDRYEARRAIVTDIEALGLLDRVEAKKIMQPFGDRSKVVIEPMLTDQWFVDAEKLAGPALDAVRDGRTRILPERDTKTYFHWLENIEPWCISRQLWWGHQIPVWYDDAGREYCATTEAEAQTMAGNRTLTRDPDVLDTWFSSGLWPIGTLGWPEDTPEMRRYFPTSVLITGFDIIFFWVARMMMMQLATVGQVPFHTVYVHALVRDEKGKKMSKSLGNVLDPLDLIDEFGADALRFTLASMAAMGRDVKLSRDRIAGYRNFGTKLWNAARFAEMNGCVPGDRPAPAHPVNRWILGETGRVRIATDAALEAFRFNDAANGLYAFVWGTVCDWYVEMAKPLLAEGHPARAETQATMAWVLDRCLMLLHPFMPFLTEHLWGQIAPRDRLLALTDWPQDGDELADHEADMDAAWVIGLIEEIRSVRAEVGVPAAAQVPLVLLSASGQVEARLGANADLIRRMARVPRVEAATEAPRGAVTLSAPGATLVLPLAGVIDVVSEAARLKKAGDKLAAEMAGIGAKLGNAGFLAKAPEEVVEEQRERLAAAEAEVAKVKAALARLATLV